MRRSKKEFARAGRAKMGSRVLLAAGCLGATNGQSPLALSRAQRRRVGGELLEPDGGKDIPDIGHIPSPGSSTSIGGQSLKIQMMVWLG